MVGGASPKGAAFVVQGNLLLGSFGGAQVYIGAGGVLGLLLRHRVDSDKRQKP